MSQGTEEITLITKESQLTCLGKQYQRHCQVCKRTMVESEIYRLRSWTSMHGDILEQEIKQMVCDHLVKTVVVARSNRGFAKNESSQTPHFSFKSSCMAYSMERNVIWAKFQIVS